MTDHADHADHADQEQEFARLMQLAREAAEAPVKPAVHQAERAMLLQAAASWASRVSRASRTSRAVRMPRVEFHEPWARWWWLGAAGVLACVGALALTHWFASDRPLTYAVQGGQSNVPNYVAAPSDAPADVRFSDGSEISVVPGARLRIERTHVDGARVLIENGSVRVHVKHRKQSSWWFVAGPFEVHVTGTRFRVAWDQAIQAIDLTLQEGSVEVHSPLGSSHCVVRGGQRFRASMSAGTMRLDNTEPEPQSTPVSAAPAPSVPVTPAPALLGKTATRRMTRLGSQAALRGSAARRRAYEQDHDVARERAASSDVPDAPHERAVVSAPVAKASAWDLSLPGGDEHAVNAVHPVNDVRDVQTVRDAQAVREAPQAGSSGDDVAQPAQPAVDAWPARQQWSELVRRGSFRAVVEAASARGLEQTLNEGSARELRALADAARYLGSFDLAERCLLTLRTRFVSSKSAATAAFLLARVYEASEKSARADTAFLSYLSEAPGGEFAADALAGHMRLVAALSGPSAARPIAREYLRRYGDGVHADLARRLADGP
jgi:TolA-binding protein